MSAVHSLDGIQPNAMSNPVTHFEIYAEQPRELADFYRRLFGWTIEQAPGIDYWRVQTGSSGNGGYSGGLTYRPIPAPHSWVHYVTVESIDESVVLVQRLGGSIVRAKAAVPKTGWYAVMADPEGNVFAVWQPDRNAMPPLVPED